LRDFNALLAGLQQNNLVNKQYEQVTPVTQPVIQNDIEQKKEIVSPKEVQEPRQEPQSIGTGPVTNVNGGVIPAPVPKVANTVFNVTDFRSLVKRKSHTKNKTYAAGSIGKISGYSIGHDCIRTTVYKMLGYELSDYSSNWLPLGFRAALGTAVHDYMQDLAIGELFSECELTLKVPSLRLSMRLDAMINDDTIVEIKSCSYADYSKIMRTRIPRTGDFYQVVFYRWLLQNHLEEIKQQKPSHGGTLPSLPNYDNVKNIVMIYVCHELIAGDDNESMAEAVKFGTNLRRYAKKENPGPNDFWFILPLTIKTDDIDIDGYEKYLTDKLDSILEHYNAKKIPDMSNPYVDTSKCFFCGFKSICNPPKK